MANGELKIDNKGAFQWTDAKGMRHKLKGKGKPEGLEEKQLFKYFRRQERCQYVITNDLGYGVFKSTEMVDGFRALELILDRKDLVLKLKAETEKEEKEKAEALMKEREEAIRKRMSEDSRSLVAEMLGITDEKPGKRPEVEKALETVSNTSPGKVKK